MTYDWLTQGQIEELVNPVLALRGMALLNINEEAPTCRVLGAFWDGELVEVFAFQMYPILGPLLKILPEFRDNGETSRELARRMQTFLEAVKARGFMAIADSPITERLCERFSMNRLSAPVYSYVRSEDA